jgi:hypothetical protein
MDFGCRGGSSEVIMTAGEEDGVADESKRVEGVKRTPYERDADDADGDLSLV